jgi:chemotaxis protein CheX
MSAGNSATALADMNVIIDITPPTLINGRTMVTMISQVETLVLEFTGDVGKLEINIALEM